MARKILLADDSVTAQNMGRKILADAGYEVITVNNGSAALKKIAETKPDLIVLDVYMPGYSGLEVCQRLKEAGDTARIPVLLTVGKLEPFKPEEAKRVRAEGFIVKPFEASELLSALTKLEDKMVPRAESSKPGRFARTIAVVEEGRHDKTMAGDEDAGWKNRISFPSKKKAKTAEPDDSDDSAIYNPVNKDLRTVVESKPARAPETSAPVAKAPANIPANIPAIIEESRVDLGALAPEGLPKDVTPEEIAALAAAAAQMQGKIQAQSTAAEATADSKAADSAPTGESRIAESKAGDAKIIDSQIGEVKTFEAVAAQPRAPELAQESAGTEERTPATEAAPAATFAEQKLEEKKAEAIAEAAANVPLPSSAEVTAAIAALETSSVPSSSSGAGDALPDHDRKAEPEPVTMAVAAAHGSAAPRWTAVAVSLTPEESGLALEQEMRKAYAAYAAYDGAASRPAQEIPSVSEAQPAVTAAMSAEISAPVETPLPAPEGTNAQMLEAAASAAAAGASADVASVRVKSFETVGASSEAKADEVRRDEFKSDEVTPAASEAAASTAETAAVQAPALEARGSEIGEDTQKQAPQEAASQVASEPARLAEKYEESASGKAQLDYALPVLDQPDRVDTTQVDSVHVEQVRDEQVREEPAKYEDPGSGASSPFASYPSSVSAGDAPAIYKEAETAAVSPVAAIEPLVAASAEPVAASEQPAPGAQDGSGHDVSGQEGSNRDGSSHDGSSHDKAGKETDIAATTAAAWESWRRVRESGTAKDAREPEKSEDSSSASRDEAAMAVAAGAETAPEEGPEIASIVDSVLADLRPKIVEEISKKLKKKK